MSIKEIARRIVQHDESFSCRIRPKLTQIELKCSLWPDETVRLLSPYYQAKIRGGTFDEGDLENVLIEVDRIKRFGV